MENYNLSFADPTVDIFVTLYILDPDRWAFAGRPCSYQMFDIYDPSVSYKVSHVNSICGKFSRTQFPEVILEPSQCLPGFLVVFSPIKSEMRDRVRRRHQMCASMSVKHVVSDERRSSRLFPAVQCPAEIRCGRISRPNAWPEDRHVFAE
jgi:hypothetical protein